MVTKMSFKNWLPLLGLTCAAFIFNTSEFIPIGLLSDIAEDFSTTEAHAGMLISVYAWIVMVLSLPLMLLVSKIELRKLMLCTIVMFMVCQLLSSFSTTYSMLMASRIGVACTHAIFWSIVSPLAVSIVPDYSRPLALSMIVTGTSIAMIFGLPLGRLIGLSIGWRTTFLYVGIIAFITAIYLMSCLPKVPNKDGFTLHNLPALLKNPLLIGLYILSLLVATSYYTGYSYIEPFLKQVAGLSDGLITTTLMIFGGAGIIGSFSFSRFYPKNSFRFMNTVLLGIAASLLLFRLSALLPATVIMLCAVWGMAVTAFNVALQAEIINHSPQNATSISMSIFSGIFNLGIGCGTLLGGYVCTYIAIDKIGYVGGAVAVMAFVYWYMRVQKLLRAKTD